VYFNSLEFWVFFVFVLALVHLLPHRGQNIVLLVASYVFYGAWDWRFLSLIAISTAIDFWVAPLAAPGRSLSSRRFALAASAAVNLGILGFFKYFNFFSESFADLFGMSYGPNDVLLNIILPVGISFYTFQSMSYTIDVYAGKLRPVRSFFDFALYVSFFPQLVAGPIERGARLIPQVVAPRRIDPDRMGSACALIIWGLFKKIFIADTVAHAVNAVYAGADPTGPEIYLATIGFAVQIYCDFSGYSDIARGLARLMGFELMLNFNLPYTAKSPSEFWRRWHISLSTWLRDYLYIPLGGSRNGKWQTCRNLMITMALGGLWHGARYNFLIWGCYHGVLLVLQHMFRRRSDVPAKRSNRLVSTLQILGMFHLVLFGWLLFRVENMSQFERLMAGLLGPWDSWVSAWDMLLYMALPLTSLAVVQIWQGKTGELEVLARASWPVRTVVLSLMISAILFLNRSNTIEFIYFQF
jgi:D-alanyl-lipoteichoic acid acyltransferase DltB (MBOAT superfamily)